MSDDMSTQPYHDSTYLKEVWGLFGVGVLVFALRFLVRLRAVGIRGLQGDDYMAIVVLCCYVVDAVTVTMCYNWGTNLDFTVERLEQMTDRQRWKIEVGSKMQLLAWYTYTGLVWGLKAQMLFFYKRLTFGLKQQWFVKVMFVVITATWTAVFLTITLGCYPTHRNWQVLPSPGYICEFKPQNFYVSTVLNVLTDAAILAIPLPLLWTLRVPLKRKLVLYLLLSSGLFVIGAAITRLVMTLLDEPSALTINRWGVRETIAGIIAVNCAIIKPFFTKVFWSRNFPPKDQHAGSKPYTYTDRDSRKRKGKKLDTLGMTVDDEFDPPSHELGAYKGKPDTNVVELDAHSGHSSMQRADSNDSSERILASDDPGTHARSYSEAMRSRRRDSDDEERVPTTPARLEIMVESTVHQHTPETELPASAWSSTRPWSAGWPTRDYGNKTTVEATNRGEER